MPRPPRTIIGNIIYHVLNRANGGVKIFQKNHDYQAFEKILLEGKKKYPMRLLAYSLMPNHWHLVLYPQHDDELAIFMRWVTLTHTQRWHVHYQNVGYGHLYQGRYKSFPVQKDEHFLQLCRYVERNALRSKLVQQAEDWRWSSLWRRTFGTSEQKTLLTTWPLQPDKDYLQWVNAPQPKEELAAIRLAVNRGRPFGGEVWVQRTASRLGLESTFRSRGRPRYQ